MTSVTKDTLIGDILDFDLETAEYFFEIGMHCLGCPASRGESIAEACMVHGTNADELVAKINATWLRRPKNHQQLKWACCKSTSSPSF